MFKVLTRKFSYVEHFALMDGRLVLCGLAVSVAMFALLWDWLNPFPLSRYKYHRVVSSSKNLHKFSYFCALSQRMHSRQRVAVACTAGVKMAHYRD